MTATATVQQASWQDYWQLTKPRVVLVMQFTAVIGMLLSTPTFPPWLLMVTGFCRYLAVRFRGGRVQPVSRGRRR